MRSESVHLAAGWHLHVGNFAPPMLWKKSNTSYLKSMEQKRLSQPFLAGKTSACCCLDKRYGLKSVALQAKITSASNSCYNFPRLSWRATTIRSSVPSQCSNSCAVLTSEPKDCRWTKHLGATGTTLVTKSIGNIIPERMIWARINVRAVNI